MFAKGRMFVLNVFVVNHGWKMYSIKKFKSRQTFYLSPFPGKNVFWTH